MNDFILLHKICAKCEFPSITSFSFNFLNFLFIDLIYLFLSFNFNVKLWASFSVKYLLNNFKLLIITILGFILVLEFKFSLTFFFLEVQG